MTRIKVIVPTFDCFEFLGLCLTSLADQEQPPADVVVIDDASSDHRQPEFIVDVTRRLGWKAYLSNENRRCPYNIWLGITLLDANPDDVIMIVDGDDWLPHDRVLSRIVDEYADPDCWLTYGSYEPVPPDAGCHPAMPYPRHVIDSAGYRSWNIWFNHPITFKKFLWDGVTESDLQDDNGCWFRGGYDQAIMYPMLEMAGEHQRFIPDVLYSYNTKNPLSDGIANPVDCAVAGQTLRRRPSKSKLG